MNRRHQIIVNIVTTIVKWNSMGSAVKQQCVSSYSSVNISRRINVGISEHREHLETMIEINERDWEANAYAHAN
jgi:hypothetical protein